MVPLLYSIAAFALLSSASAAKLGDSKGLPSFEFSYDRTGADAVPNLRVTFPDGGEADDVILERYNPFGPESPESAPADDCLFVGWMAGNPEGSSVAVTGCGDRDGDQVHITTIDERIGGSKMYAIDNGEVHETASPFEHGVTESVGVSVRNDDGIYSSSEWTLVEGDELVNKAAEQKIQEMCANGACMAAIPPAHLLRVATAYDTSLAAHEGANVPAWINRVFTHVQGHMYHPSLPTRITIQLVGAPKYYSNRRWTATNYTLEEVRRIVVAEGTSANLVAFFCKDQTTYGTVGIAYVGGLCSSKFQVSLNEWQQTPASTGKLVAHELGHNFGMDHDFHKSHAGKGCTGIMDYGENRPDAWSACSQQDFRNHYQAVLYYSNKRHCMQTMSGSCTGDKGKSCVFPFNYKGVNYNGCVNIDNNKFWCYVNVQTGEWQNCAESCPKDGCKGDKGKSCVFPFKYNGVTYGGCTNADSDRFWCYVDAQTREWQYCVEGCPKDPDGCRGDKGNPCAFPFTYNGVTYSGCTKADHERYWCDVDTTTGEWQNCEEGCPIG